MTRHLGLAVYAFACLAAVVGCNFDEAVSKYCTNHPEACVDGGGSAGGGGGASAGGGTGGGGDVDAGASDGGTDGGTDAGTDGGPDGGPGLPTGTRLVLVRQSPTPYWPRSCYAGSIQLLAEDGGLGAASQSGQVTATLSPAGAALYSGETCTGAPNAWVHVATAGSQFVEMVSWNSERAGTFTLSLTPTSGVATPVSESLTFMGQLMIIGLPTELPTTGCIPKNVYVALVDQAGHLTAPLTDIQVTLTASGPLGVFSPGCSDAGSSVLIPASGGGFSEPFAVGLSASTGAGALTATPPTGSPHAQTSQNVTQVGAADCLLAGSRCVPDGGGYQCCTSSSCQLDPDAGYGFCR